MISMPLIIMGLMAGVFIGGLIIVLWKAIDGRE